MSSQRHRTAPQRPDAASGLRFVLRLLLVVALVALTLPIAPAPASAAASLTITPITWNVTGLDSNNEATGPDTFASGARVCNAGDAAATNVVATYVWDTANTYVNLSGPATLSVGSLAAGTCTDLYFNVAISRNDLARLTARGYHITATADGLGTVSTPTPREIFVENLVSQNRNSINSITGPTSVYVGGTYTYVLNADTATNGYEELASFLNFPNTIFQILSVNSTYTTGGSNDTIYADACGWQNDPTIVATYRSCVGPSNPVYGPKAGGTVVTTYSVKILAVPGGGATGSVSLTGLVYDFSGSSYHYNSDHGTESITVNVSKAADLSITKSDSPDPVTAGNDVTYSMTVSNAGPSTAESVTVTDPLPAGTSYSSATPSQGSCSVAAGTLTCGLGDIASGGSATITLVMNVNPSRTEALSNTATVTSTTTDPTPGNNSAVQATTVSTSADLSITKSDSPDPVGAGETLTYTLTASNAGPSDAQSVVVTDTLPGDVTFGSATPSQGSCSRSGVTLTCTLGTIAASGGASVTITVTPTAAAGVAGSVSNTASVAPATSDPSNANNSATQGTTVQPRADVRISKTDSVDPVVAGNTVTYSMTVTNDGPSSAVNVTVTDPLPAGTSFVTATGGGTESGGIVTWSLGSMASGAATTIQLVVRVHAGRTVDISNTATVSTTTTDPTPGNDAATQATTVSTSADLSIAKTDSPDPVGVGNTLTYSLTVSNAGPSDAQSVVVTDTLPASVTFGSATPSQGSCSRSGVTVTCDLGTIAASSSATVTITVTPTAAAGAAGSVSNTASVSSSTSDPSNANNSATQDTTVQPRADLSITKSDSPNTVVAGQDVTYTITVSNAGPSAAAGVSVTDVIPTGTSYVSASPSQGSCSVAAGTLTCGLGSIASGANATITLVVSVNPSRTADLLNTATATSTTTDPTPGNNSATEATTVSTSADLSMTKTDSADPVAVGQSFSYTLAVANAGPSDAAAVVVTDTLPADVTFGSATPSQGTCSRSGVTVTCALGTVAASGGASVTISVTPTAAAGVAGSVSNTASVSSSTSDPSNGNDSDTESTGVTPVADLSVAKTGTRDPVVAGETVTYTITASNAGPSTAASVVVSDQVPTGTDFVSADGGGFEAGGTVTWNLGDLSSGASTVVHVTLLVLAGRLNPVDNTATVDSPTPDPDPGNDSATATTDVDTSADLSVSGVDTPDPAWVGEDVTYTLTVTNGGPSDAVDVVLDDTLPAGTVFVSSMPSQGSCGAPVGGVVTCALDDLAAGTSATVDVVVTATSAGRQTNGAQVSGATPDADAANDTDSQDTEIRARADMGVSITAAPDPVTAGTDLTYTIVVTNVGPSDAADVTVSSPVPNGTSFVSADAGGSLGGGTVTWNLGTVSSGGSVTLTLVVYVNPGRLADVDGSVTVSTSTTDPNPANDVATVATPVEAWADLSVTAADAPDPVAVGDDVTYTLTVTNGGPSDAVDVVLTDTLPADTVFVSATPSQGFCGAPVAGVVTCVLGGLPTGSTAAVDIVVTTTVMGTITDAVAVSSSTPDPSSANDTASADTDVTPVADLGVSIGDLATAVAAGDSTTYAVSLSNGGPSNLPAGAVVEISVPANTTASTTEPDCAVAGNTVTCTTSAALASGGSVAWQVTLDVPPDYPPGALDVTASITVWPYADPNGANDVATDSDTVDAVADLQVDVTAPSPAVPGTDLTYTIVVTNAGPSDATGVLLADGVPAGTTFVSADQGGVLGFGGLVAWSLGDLAAAGSIAVELVVHVDADRTADLSDTATVSATTTDPVSANDTDTEITPVAPSADLGVSVADAPDPVLVGDDVTYTITVTNAGPSDALAVVLDDSLPAGSSFVSATPSLGTCPAPVAGVVMCDLDDLPVGASVTIVVIVTATSAGTMTDAALVWGSTPDPNAANDSASADTTATPLTADLGVGVDDAVSTVTAGTSTTYAITLTNHAGSISPAGAAVEISIPAGTTGSTSEPDCSIVGSVMTCATSAALAVDDSVSWQLTLGISPGFLPGSLDVPASITTWTLPDPNGVNDAATDTDTVVAEADLAIAIDDLTTSVTPGTSTTYEITVTNLGPSTEPAGAIVTVVFPVGTTGSTTDPDCTIVGSLLTCTTATDVAPGHQRVWSFTLDVAPGFSGPSVDVTAQITSTPVTDPNPTNDLATDIDAIVGSVDVSVSIGDAPDPADLGQSVTFTLTVSNAGPSDATGVTLVDTLPAGATFVSATPSQGTCGAPVAGVLTCDLGGLAVGASATVTIVVTPTAVGTATDTAQVAADQPDPVPGNDVASASTSVLVPAASADLSIVKTDAPDPVTVGQALTYSLTVSNAGPDTATAVVVTHTLPSSLTFGSATASQGSCSAVGNAVTCTIGDLASGASATVTIVATPTGAGAITNTATVQSAVADPDLIDNSSSQGTTVNLSADVSILKTASPNPVVAGDDLTYTLNVRNDGATDAVNVVVSDPLPPGTTFVSADHGGILAGGTVTWALGTLAAGSSVTLTLVVTVDAGFAGDLSNTVAVASDTPDLDASDATATAGVTVDPAGTPVADLSVKKTVDETSPASGSKVTYTVVVSNAGPADATGLIVEDLLPSGLEYVSSSCTQGTYAAADGKWKVGDLAVGETATMTMTAKVTGKGGDVIDNVAEVAKLDQDDPDGANDRAARDVEVLAAVAAPDDPSALAFTGGAVVRLFLLMLGFTALGILILLFARRFRDEDGSPS